MDDTLSSKLKKTADDVVHRLGEVAQTASDKLKEMQERERLTQLITRCKKERGQVREAMLDLLMRMFDQNTFAEALLRPDYQRIKEIEAEMARLEKEREAIGKILAESAPEAPAAPCACTNAPVETATTPPDEG